jgi:hypothetical protein
MKNTDQKMIQEILGEDFTKKMLEEMELQHSSPEVQAELLAKLGQNIIERVMLELLSAVPEEVRGEFESHVGSGDVASFRAFLEKYISDLDEFITHHANREFEQTKTRIQMLKQGVA